MTRSIDNNGIGALYATFAISKTADEYDLTADNEGDAVAVTDANECGPGSDGSRLLGRLEHVTGGLAVVQIGGVARFAVNGAKTAPGIGDGVVIDGAGKVYQAPEVAAAEGDPAGGNVARGLVLWLDSTSAHCDVLL